MSNAIYTRFFCEEVNICENPLCNNSTNNPKYCSLSCGNIHRGLKSQEQKIKDYESNPKICARDGCNNLIKFSNRNSASYCSRSCSTTRNNKIRVRKPATDDFKEKMRQINLAKNIEKRLIEPLKKCVVCGMIIKSKNRKTCSDQCYRKLLQQQMKIYVRLHPTHKYNRSPTKQSWMERTFEEWLNNHGMLYGFKGYLNEVWFYNDETKKYGRVDFLFPRLRLIIELDGTHHIIRKELDNIRDEYLTKRGWTVIRITHKEYKNKSRLSEVKNLLGFL